MKTLIIIFSFLIAGSAQAAQILHCTSIAPRYPVVLSIQSTGYNNVRIDVRVSDLREGKVATGTFFGQIVQTPNYKALYGTGVLAGTKGVIQGDLNENSSGGVSIAIHTYDHHFDWGYGFNLGCR